MEKNCLRYFKGIFVKMIDEGRDSLKIKQVLLYWGYELKKLKKVESKSELSFLLTVLD